MGVSSCARLVLSWFITTFEPMVPGGQAGAGSTVPHEGCERRSVRTTPCKDGDSIGGAAGRCARPAGRGEVMTAADDGNLLLGRVKGVYEVVQPSRRSDRSTYIAPAQRSARGGTLAEGTAAPAGPPG